MADDGENDQTMVGAQIERLARAGVGQDHTLQVDVLVGRDVGRTARYIRWSHHRTG